MPLPENIQMYDRRDACVPIEKVVRGLYRWSEDVPEFERVGQLSAVDASAERLSKSLLLVSTNAKKLEKMPVVWSWPKSELGSKSPQSLAVSALTMQGWCRDHASFL